MEEVDIMGKLDGKVAIVTGAAVGNGNGTAWVLAKQGAIVILTDVSTGVVDAAKEIRKAGFEADACVMDVSKFDEVQQAMDRIADKYGKIDILVNNAGVCRVAPFLEIDDKMRDFHWNVNINGVWNCSKAVIPYMEKANYGKVVNLSSVTGTMVVDVGETAYATTKAAIWGFTKALAIEVAPYNITVNAVCPGYILTPMAESIARDSDPDNPNSVLEGIAAAVPMRRLGTMEEVGDLVAFFASDESRYITGTQMVIDGGSTLPETFGAVHSD
jgi:NAD(P)-dependent dehydrogenase (short-subunit alcohol dehydrogenase family)